MNWVLYKSPYTNNIHSSCLIFVVVVATSEFTPRADSDLYLFNRNLFYFISSRLVSVTDVYRLEEED